MFWQLTIDANDPARLAWFWARALGYQPVPPAGPDTTWHRHYRARLGARGPSTTGSSTRPGLRPPIWFQKVPEGKFLLQQPLWAAQTYDRPAEMERRPACLIPSR